MNEIELSIGAYVIGHVNGLWGLGDVVEGNKYVRGLVSPLITSTKLCSISIVWAPLHVDEGLEDYIWLTNLYDESSAAGNKPADIINNIVKEFFNECVDGTADNDTSQSLEILFTVFLQSLYVALSSPMPVTSLTHH